jgi:hypothetical protein
MNFLYPRLCTSPENVEERKIKRGNEDRRGIEGPISEGRFANWPPDVLRTASSAVLITFHQATGLLSFPKTDITTFPNSYLSVFSHSLFPICSDFVKKSSFFWYLKVLISRSCSYVLYVLLYFGGRNMWLSFNSYLENNIR